MMSVPQNTTACHVTLPDARGDSRALARRLRARPGRAAASGPRRAAVARPRRSSRAPAAPRAAASDDDDFAVFRFTLGIPGFDDEDIPRVVGLVGASLLVANHLASPTPSDAQARTELLGAFLAAACAYAPALGRRLDENRVVAGGAGDVAGGEQVFAIAPGQSDAVKADVAWATYALLTQTNASAAVVWREGEGVTCARGACAFRPPAGAPGAAEVVLEQLTKSVGAALERGGSGDPGNDSLAEESGAVYLRDRGAVDRAGANAWGFLPQGAESVLVQPSASGDARGEARLVLLSDKPRAFSKKQRAWIAAVANKLAR